jgi:hypothetical protein
MARARSDRSLATEKTSFSRFLRVISAGLLGGEFSQASKSRVFTVMLHLRLLHSNGNAGGNALNISAPIVLAK